MALSRLKNILKGDERTNKESYGLRYIDTDRVQIGKKFTEEEINEVEENRDIEVLQIDSYLPKGKLPILNRLFSRRPDIELRIYSFHDHESIINLDFLQDLKSIRKLSIDSIRELDNFETVVEIEELKTLSLALYDIEEFTERVGDRYRELVTAIQIHAKKGDKVNAISEYPNVTEVYLEGSSNGVASIGKLDKVEKLTLRSISVDSLDFLKELERLKTVEIKLGGTRNLHGLKKLSNLQHLELWQIREFEDLSFLSKLEGLRTLYLQSLPRISSFPDIRELTNLEKIILVNMKGLKDLSALKDAPVLKEFRLVEGVRQKPVDLIPVLENPSLRKISAHFSSDKKNREFERLRETYT